MKRVGCLFVMGLWAIAVDATPGGLDKSGCHHPKEGAYHCHPNKGAAKPGAIGPKNVPGYASTKMGKRGARN
jgi:hypothetical protein